MTRRIAAGAATLSATLLLSLFGAGDAAVARHGQDRPGDFDYYLLSLSWSPAYCLESAGGAECRGTRRYGFIVHGLWPQRDRGWPEYCATSARVSDAVVRGVADLMPAPGLVHHEWSAHGSCSGLPPREFFALVRRAYGAVTVPPPFIAPTAAVEQAPDAVAAAFLRSNPRLTPDSLVVTCSRQGLPRLREVRICLDRDLRPRACSAEARRGGCRAGRLLIAPVR